MMTARPRVLITVAVVLYVVVLGCGLIAQSRSILTSLSRTLADIVSTATPVDTSPHRTIEPRDDVVTVDFHQCTPERMRISVTFGSTTLAVLGLEGDSCRLDFGGEIEQPNWDGKLTRTCRIPARLGKVTLAKKSGGLDLSYIDRYCADIP